MTSPSSCRRQGDDASVLAERIRNAIDRAAIEIDGHPYHFTASIGLVEPGDDRTVTETIARFDHALAEAKERGGNTVVTG